MQWQSPYTKPPKPGIYRVQVPAPAADNADALEERFARWTGDYWTSWAPDERRAAMCHWRGPSAGYLWASI
jgi:hypothetical protein